MAYYDSSNILMINRSKLYQRSREFQKFQEINEKDLTKIKEDVINFLNRLNISNSILTSSKLENNIAVLTYLTLSTTNAVTTFDYRILFYILACDPELISFKEHLKTYANPLEKQKAIRDEIGFYDEQLAKYESAYFAKFLKDKELLHGIGINIMPLLLLETEEITTLSSITPKRFKDILNRIKKYHTELLPTDDYKTILYHIYRQQKLLGIKSVPEKLIFFIMSTDPSFQLLTIYEEESRWDIVKQRALTEVGYFSKELIRKERILKNEFFPNLVLTEWEKILEDQSDETKKGLL